MAVIHRRPGPAGTGGRGARSGRPQKQETLAWLRQPEVIEKFGRISDAIWSYAELGLQEHKSSALLIRTLEENGFKVERGLAGMPTCFVATAGSGRPVVGILAEYDALPGLSQKGRTAQPDPVVAGAPGHGCGHNMMGTAAVAAAIAVKRVMDQGGLGGTIKVFGSPAEEMLISRPYMARAGLFGGVDAVINNHAGSAFSTQYGVTGTAMCSVIYSFEGKTAHSGGSPWSGRSALDAVEIMNVATNYLREHMHFASRMHYVIVNGGEAPNVVPDRASVWYYLRNTDEKLEELCARVLDCAKGAALATGTKLAEVRVLGAAHQSHHNKALSALLQRNIEMLGMPKWSEEEHQFARALQRHLGAKQEGMPAKPGTLQGPAAVFTGGASSDHGDVTLLSPTATVRFPGNVPGTQGHHWSTVTCGNGSAAWKGLSAGAQAMAATAVDLLANPNALRAVRAEFDEYVKKHPYKSFLPAEARPPLDINEKMMIQHRPLMERFYLEQFN